MSVGNNIRALINNLVSYIFTVVNKTFIHTSLYAVFVTRSPSHILMC